MTLSGSTGRWHPGRCRRRRSDDGTTFQTIGHLMGRRVSGTFEVTHYEAGKSYGFRSLSGPMQIVTLFTLET